MRMRETVAEAIARALKRHGVETIFAQSLPSAVILACEAIGIRQLAYRLYTLCERKGWAEEARAYNELVTSWPAIVEESQKVGHKGEQLSLV